MADPTENKDDLMISEAQDGSATVDLPENMLSAADLDQNDGSEGQNDGSDGDSGANDLTPEVQEARRNRRRAKKDLIRKTNQEKDVRLQQLQRENEEFKRRLSQLERNTKAEHVTRIEKGMEDASVRLEYAKMKLAEATQNQDGQAMVEAQTLWQNAQDEVKKLSWAKQQAEQELRRPQAQNVPDPGVQKLAADWIRKNSWYRIDGNDADSRIAKKMDELLVTQGWDPADPDYWEELDSRLREELPHRYNGSNGESRGVGRPRNVVGSSGREASSAYGGVNRTQFVLSPERVRAMKEAGAWDNPERKARMIKQFIAFDRTNRT